MLEGRRLGPEVAESAELLATVVGQDLEETPDATLRIDRRVARDRVISTVDPEARHGHKTQARGFDGYKGHLALDPDSDIITDTVVTPANAGDAGVACDLIDDLAGEEAAEADGVQPTGSGRPEDLGSVEPDHLEADGQDASGGPPTVYGDAAYGTGEFLDRLARAGVEARCKTQPPTAPNAPPQRGAAQSRWAATSTAWPRPAADSATPTGRPTTGPTQARAQDRPPDATPPRGTASTGAWPTQGRRRLQPPRRRPQRGPPRRARSPFHHHRMGSRHRMKEPCMGARRAG